MGQKITPNLWFDGAKEAVDFYVAAFPNSKIASTTYYPNSAAEGLADFQKDMAGKELMVEFELSGQQFTAINGGPDFKFNPSISFLVNFDPSRDEQAREHLDELWSKLSEGGEVLMELGEYPFSKHYGWIKDKYGLTWQLVLSNSGDEWRPFITPSLMFSKENTNHAEEAINFYVSVFKNAKLGELFRYTEDKAPVEAGSIMFGDFMLEGQWFTAMDSAVEQAFSFNEAISLLVACKDQAEIDYFWEKLSAVPESEQCGWAKDKYGVSWQIIPENLGELMQKPGAFAKLMQMKKIVIEEF
jgi:predicted 3-demethylubiquinone-9 3-methyltransferase (glyoxalase superfamily)